MTSQREKPPVQLSPTFQGGLLLFIAGIGITILIAFFNFSKELNHRLDNYEYRISNIEDKQKITDTRIELLVGNNYSFRQQTK